jgi:phage baseplate assembly protein W
MDFLGCPYPIVKKPQGLLGTQSGLNQVKSDLLCLLLTNPGERVMLPDYGTPLRRLIFEQNDSVLAEQARAMIIASIRQWEPRITVEAIEVSSNIDEDSLHEDDLKDDIERILSIRIVFYDPEEIKELQELRLQVPLSGGTT